MLRWVLYFPFVQLISIFCKLTAPVVCLPYTVKDGHEWLIKPFRYWQSFDHPVDHYFWAGYSKYSWFKFIRECTQERYKQSWWIRYLYRVLWVERNTAMGFSQEWFGRNPDQSHFQIKKQIPLFGGYYNDINIGWKAHKGFTRLMYAGRIIGIRKNK